jgi:hypothetical protein
MIGERGAAFIIDAAGGPRSPWPVRYSLITHITEQFFTDENPKNKIGYTSWPNNEYH